MKMTFNLTSHTVILTSALTVPVHKSIQLPKQEFSYVPPPSGDLSLTKAPPTSILFLVICLHGPTKQPSYAKCFATCLLEPQKKRLDRHMERRFFNCMFSLNCIEKCNEVLSKIMSHRSVLVILTAH